MTSRERITRILARQPVDRIGLFEHFWGPTHQKWVKEGFIKEGEDLADHFGFDIAMCWNLNFVAKLDYQNVTVEEDAETILIRDGNGALLRRHKLHDSTPEHVDFTVRDRDGWEEHIKPFLKFDRRRINFESYRNAKKQAAEKNRFFMWCGVNVFELMHPICGHEHMLAGMALDPDWITEMTTTLSDLILQLQETLFAEEGKPDGIWFYEDMGFKERPFMSPDMYMEMVYPAHKKTFDYAHSLGLPVVVHSCGFVEPLLPGLIQAGMDALQVMEIKAGMDSCRIKKNYGDKIALIGGMDVRCLTSNDMAWVDRELDSRIPILKQGSGYVLHSDHSIPDTVDYKTYRHFVDRGLQLGTY